MSKKAEKVDRAAVEAPARALLTPEQVGEIYQVTGRTVRNWLEEGAIPAEVCEGRIIRFDLDAVRAALRKRARSEIRTPGKMMVI